MTEPGDSDDELLVDLLTEWLSETEAAWTRVNRRWQDGQELALSQPDVADLFLRLGTHVAWAKAAGPGADVSEPALSLVVRTFEAELETAKRAAPDPDAPLHPLTEAAQNFINDFALATADVESLSDDEQERLRELVAEHRLPPPAKGRKK